MKPNSVENIIKIIFMAKHDGTHAIWWISISENDKYFKQENDQRVLDLNECKANDDKGHILEVDKEYLKELYDSHNDYPLSFVLIRCT